MQQFRFCDFQERKASAELRACWASTTAFQAQLAHQAQVSLPGIFCPICRDYREVVRDALDIREGMVCDDCKMGARLRFGLSLLAAVCDRDSDVYITEQATTAFVWLQCRGYRVDGSEFEPDPLRRAALTRYMHELGGRGEIQFQDVTGLSFPTASKDVVLSFDVLEHVPDYRLAITEFRRVLRPGGRLIATFPFTDGPETVVRARLGKEGDVEHLMEPEYHGDPISGGVLCFYHFGWDILDVARACGFSEAAMVMPWAPQRGLHYGLWTLVASA